MPLLKRGVESRRARQEYPRHLTAAGAELGRYRFLGDVQKRVFGIIALKSRHYGEAESPSQRYRSNHALKTLDALQLAVALDLKTHKLAAPFVAADRVLCKVAEIAGMIVHNPQPG